VANTTLFKAKSEPDSRGRIKKRIKHPQRGDELTKKSIDGKALKVIVNEKEEKRAESIFRN
jgi:hypothetical protein